jgi:hypothetical protein
MMIHPRNLIKMMIQNQEGDKDLSSYKPPIFFKNKGIFTIKGETVPQ